MRRLIDVTKFIVCLVPTVVLGVMGGWPGAILGQQVFRHKTIKLSFRIVLCLICSLHVGLIALFMYMRLR